jgi:hypothetical protein
MTKQHITDHPSPFLNLIISQGRIERFLLDNIADNSNSTLTVERGVAAESLVYDASLENDHEAYPIKVTLRGLQDAEANPAPVNGGFGGRDILAKNSLPGDELKEFEAAASHQPEGVETIEARYLIGADGAHSWVRHALDYKTQGSGVESLWWVHSQSDCVKRYAVFLLTLPPQGCNRHRPHYQFSRHPLPRLHRERTRLHAGPPARAKYDPAVRPFQNRS